MCSGSEAGSYVRLIDFVYHSTLGLGVIKKRISTSFPESRMVTSLLPISIPSGRDPSCRQTSINYFTELCSGSEAGSYLRLIDFVDHSTLGLRVIKKKKRSTLSKVGSRSGLASGLQETSTPVM